MHDNYHLTVAKGTVGTVLPVFAFLTGLDPSWAWLQIGFGATVPTLMAISLAFDIRKKYRDNTEWERQEKIKEQRRQYFKSKYNRKKDRKKGITNEKETDDTVIDPPDYLV